MRCRTLVKGLVLAAAACGGEQAGQATRAAGDLADLTVRVATGKASYLAGESIGLTIGLVAE